VLSFARPRENYLYNFCHHLVGLITSNARIVLDDGIGFDEGITFSDACADAIYRRI
jgi:hypothetical protein